MISVMAHDTKLESCHIGGASEIQGVLSLREPDGDITLFMRRPTDMREIAKALNETADELERVQS